MIEKIFCFVIAGTLAGGFITAGRTILESARALPLRIPHLVEAVEEALMDPASDSGLTLKNQMQSDYQIFYEFVFDNSNCDFFS